MAVHPKGCGRILMSLVNHQENQSLWEQISIVEACGYAIGESTRDPDPEA